MNLVQLRYFSKVADLKNLTHAAEALHISQPALTRQMNLLESELGTVLFLRHARGIQLSEAGLTLRDRAEVILRLVSEAHAELSRDKVPAGSIRIGFPPSIGGLLLASIAGTLQRQMPHLSLQLVEGLSHLQQEWLLNDRVDLALMTALEPNPLLVSHPLCEEAIWMVSRAGTGETPPTAYTIEDVARRRLIQTNRNNIMRQLLERAAREKGLSLDIAMEIDALPVIKDLVKIGAGSHVSPYSGLIGDIRRGEMIGGPIKDLTITRVMVHRLDRPVSQSVLAIMDVARKEIARVAAESGNQMRPFRVIDPATKPQPAHISA